LRFFATAAKGTEGAVRDELRELRFRRVRATRGGVAFEGPMAEGWRACLGLRSAIRVLWELSSFEAHDADELYDGVRSVAWEEHLDDTTTLAVRASCRSSALTHSQFVAQRTKDAVVDRLRDHLGARPDVDRDDPDATISLHLARDSATLYLDLGGKPLHLRGYRREQLGAPLKETLAACVVRLSGWDRQTTLCDPLCGSGTIAIEAALWAAGIAPGLLGARRFGFERWRSFDERARGEWKDLVEAARAAVKPRRERTLVIASDIDQRAVVATRKNAAAAGVDLRVERRAVEELRSDTPLFGAPSSLPTPLWVVTNPPYGERLALDEADARSLGRALARLGSARLAVLAGSPDVVDAIGLRALKLQTLMNGDIECRLALYEGRP
jgi:putative N6-adenine-specific DNA methylase